MARRLAAGAALIVGGLAMPSAATGQSQADPLGGEVSDSVLGYEREEFEYVRGGRRNPFRPSTTRSAAGPRFENLEVTGIVFSPEIGSVAVVADRTTDRRYRLREGELIGDARVLEIRQDEVVFALSTFGISRQAVLRAKKEREQGE